MSINLRKGIFSLLLVFGLIVMDDGFCQSKPGKGSDVEKVKKGEEKNEETVSWKKNFVVGINLTQISFSNWAKGGDNSIAWNVRIDSDAARNGGRWDWNFSGIFLFGQNKLENESPRTTLDKIDMDGNVAWKNIPYVNPYFSLGILTQFSRGYDYNKKPYEARSNFWDPVYLTQGLGVRIKVKSVFKSHLGVGLKETITSEYRQYSDDPSTDEIEKFKFETGLESKTNLNIKIIKNFNVKSKLKMFSSFEHIKVVDLIWDTLFTARLNRYVVVSLNIQVNYDRDVIDKIQIKEVAGIGFSYNLL